jgi:hypothetical protein
MTAIAKTLSFSGKTTTLPDLSLTSDDYTISLESGFNHAPDVKINQVITFDGSSKLLFSGDNFVFVKDESTKLETRQNVTAGVYNLEMISQRNYSERIHVTLRKLVINDDVAPTLGAAITINAANDEITVPFSEGCYSAVGKTGDLVVADFTPTLTGGVATVPVLTNPVHTAGGSSITFDLAYTGIADGTEVLKIVPADGSSVFDRGSNPMLATEESVVTLNVV